MMSKRFCLLTILSIISINSIPINAQLAYLTAYADSSISNSPSIFVVNLATRATVASFSYALSSSGKSYSFSVDGVAVTPDGSRVIFTAVNPITYNDYLLVLDTTTNRIKTIIAFGSDGGCKRVVVSPDGKYAYAACKTSGNVKIADLNTNLVIKTVSVGGQPADIAIAPDGSRLYVAGCGTLAHSLCIINTANNTLTATLNIDSKKIAIAPDGSRVYLLLIGRNVAVLNATTNAQVATIDLYSWDWVNDLVVAPDGKKMYAMGTFGVTVVDTTTNKATKRATIPVTIIVDGTLAISPDGKYVYAPEPDSSTIWIVDTGTMTVSDKIILSTQVAGIKHIAIASGVAPKPAPPPPPTPAPPAIEVANAASLQGDAVAPGEIVLISGSNIGPPILTTMQITEDGLLANFLGDTRVLFDGVPAPLIYVSQNQHSAVAPYSVDGKVVVQVEYKGIKTEPVILKVVSAVPGIFTANSSGKGQAIILNENGSMNFAFNPAARSSVVTFYATGAGQTNPQGVDGKIITEGDAPPVLLLPISVSIGGTSAEVVSAGSVLGLVPGIVQVQARIPADIAAGNTVPMILTIADTSSQQGVTITVK